LRNTDHERAMAKSATRGRGRPKAASDEDQRLAVAGAAWRLFVDNGYGRTTMQDVASACGMSKRTVYRLFPGKADLFAAVVALHRTTMIALPGDYDDLPIEDALAGIFAIDADPQVERARSGLMSVFISEARQYPELQPLIREFGGEPSRRLLVEWLERQNRVGRIAIADADVAARMLMDVVFGAVSLKHGDGPPWSGGPDRPAYLRACFAMIAAGLRGPVDPSCAETAHPR
jgi:AcrR family transcriptional regulator